mgnify:CR=1 FL=1
MLAQALLNDPKLLILDEPTAVLTPQETKKLFSILRKMRDDGKLFPLFIGKTQETPVNEWVPAEIIMEHKGFSHRPGWHLGATMPSAPWLMGADGTYKSQRGKRFRRVWCEVLYVADIDYTDADSFVPPAELDLLI